MSEWKPIETAPKNNTPIIITTGWAHDAWQQVIASRRGSAWTICGSSKRVFHPTHWMPLPAPPESLDPSTLIDMERITDEMTEQDMEQEEAASNEAMHTDDYSHIAPSPSADKE